MTDSQGGASVFTSELLEGKLRVTLSSLQLQGLQASLPSSTLSTDLSPMDQRATCESSVLSLGLFQGISPDKSFLFLTPSQHLNA